MVLELLGLQVVREKSSVVAAMATASLTPQQYQQLIDRISELETRMLTLQSHAEAQQEQIRVAEVEIKQLRAAGTPDESASTIAYCFPETSD